MSDKLQLVEAWRQAEVCRTFIFKWHRGSHPDDKLGSIRYYDGPTLVQKQFGLNNDEKLFLSAQPPSILINLRNWPHHCGEFVRIGPAVQSRSFQVASLA